jgi:hypothetical protein
MPKKMSRKTEIENLIKVKNELADKYERLAKSVQSKPRSRSYRTRAEHHRRQAAVLAKKL